MGMGQQPFVCAYVRGDSMSNPKRTLLLMQIAVRDGRATTGARRLLLDAIVLRANPKEWTCFPSYARLAVDTGLNEATLRRAAKELEDAGLIKRRIRLNRSNVFTVCCDRIEALAGEATQKLLDPEAFEENSQEASSAETNERNSYSESWI